MTSKIKNETLEGQSTSLLDILLMFFYKGIVAFVLFFILPIHWKSLIAYPFLFFFIIQGLFAYNSISSQILLSFVFFKVYNFCYDSQRYAAEVVKWTLLCARWQINQFQSLTINMVFTLLYKCTVFIVRKQACLAFVLKSFIF